MDIFYERGRKVDINKMNGIEVSFRITFHGGKVDSKCVPIVEIDKVNHCYELLENSVVGMIVYVDGPQISFERDDALLDESAEKIASFVEKVERLTRELIYQEYGRPKIAQSLPLPETIRQTIHYQAGKYQN